MAQYRYIKDFYNRVIGSLEDVGDEVIARDFYNKVLGYYRKKEDITQNFYRKVIGKGDLTSGLIWQAHNNRKNNGKTS